MITSTEEFPDILPDPSSMAKRWIWRDETNSLEQISSGIQQHSDKTTFTKTKERRKGATAKGIPKMVQHAKMVTQLTSSLKATSPKPLRTKTPSTDLRKVTLDDVKKVSLELLLDVCELTDGFEEISRGEQFDELLEKLLLYFDAFFDRVALDLKREKDVTSELSATEKKAYLNVEQRLDEAQKLLAKRYCILIMGLDTEGQHHMICGKRRKSHTKKDKDFYENLYSYCSFVVWITFKRTYFEHIQEEMGRLFRSASFNPHGVPLEDPEFKLAYQLTKLEIKEITLSPTSVRKTKRPAIQSILKQRSPVLVALFPNAKESASWLFDRRTSFPLANKHKSADEIGEKKKKNKKTSLMRELHVGIIGEFMRGFNQNNLAPFGDEHEVEDKR